MGDDHIAKADDNYFQRVAERMLSFQRTGLFCDTALVARDQKLIYAHSAMLASVCHNLGSTLNPQPFFKPMPNVIDVAQYDVDVVEELIQCIYTGRVIGDQSTELQDLYNHLGVDGPELSASDGNLVLTDDAVLVVKQERDVLDLELMAIDSRPITESEIAVDLFESERYIKRRCSVRSVGTRKKSLHKNEKSNYNFSRSNVEFTAVQKLTSKQRRTHNDDARPYVCCECCRRFKSPLLLKTHVYTVHVPCKSATLFQCKLCDKLCTTYDILKKHINLHLWHLYSTDVKPILKCRYCRKVFKYEQSLVSHIRVHEMSGHRIVDGESEVTGSVTDNFRITIPKRKPPGKTHVCPLCNKGFRGPARLRIHISRHTGELPYVCNICGKRFANAEYIKKHQLIHSGNRGHKCTLCSKSFFSQSSLLCHINTHTGTKPYVCEVCGRAFSQVSSIIKHRKSHNQTNPGHLCQMCGKKFASWSSYSCHVRKHSGERPFSCEDCGKRFIRLYDLQTHRFEHSQCFPYVCPDCGRGFGNSSKLKRHILTFHTPNDEKPFKCSYCNKGYAEKYLLKQHLQGHGKLRLM